MDIASTQPVKFPHRTDAGRALAAADGSSPEDFSAELGAAIDEARNEPTDRSRRAGDAKTDTKADASDRNEDAGPANDAQEAPTVDAMVAPAVVPAPVQATPPSSGTSAIEATPNVPAQDAAGTQKALALASLTKAAGANAADATDTEPSATWAPEPQTANAGAAAQPETPIDARPALTPQTLAHAIVPQAGLNSQTKPAAAAKKTGDGKAEVTGPAPQTLQSPAAATAQNAGAAQPPATAAGQGGASKDGEGQGKSNGVHQAPAAQKSAVAAPGQEFKLDAGQALVATQTASQPAQNAPLAAPALIAQNAPVFVPPEALGVAIARKALEGVNKFELRLDPPELGRLDVSLEVDDAGRTRAHIRAERPEALELLQREAKGMEQALRQAGLNLDQSSLSFSLSGRDGREAHEHAQHGRRAKFNAVLQDDEIHAAAIRGNAAPTSGVDLRV